MVRKKTSQIIALATTCRPPEEIEQGQIIGGFAHAQVFALADQIVEAVKSGAIKKFVVMAGCDGRAKPRSYYAGFAKALPKDSFTTKIFRPVSRAKEMYSSPFFCTSRRKSS